MKKGFIIILLLAAVVLTGCGTNEGAKIEEAEIKYFDFTPAEIVGDLENWLIDFTPMGVVDNEEKAETIATYSSITDVFNTNKDDVGAMIHYMFNCDEVTDKVSRIYFFMDKNSTKATERYLYHIDSIALSIDPNANTDDIFDAIEKGFNEFDFAIYEGESFELHASQHDKYYNVSFTPIENAKGE